MKRIRPILPIVLLVPWLLHPAEVAPPPASRPTAVEQFIRDTKAPLSWLSWGADVRVRNEYFDNVISLTSAHPLSEQDVIRFRARLWTAVTPVTNVTINARLAAEPREWLKPAFVGSYRGQTGMEWRYGIADSLNVRWTNVLSQPLSITAGRQDIMLGDYWNWWLVADGTPLDGSWTFFLDSLRFQYDLRELKTKLDLIYIHQNAFSDDTLPTFNNQHVALTEQREQGVILYGSNKSLKNTTLSGYFIYKGDEQELANGDNADIYTVGGRWTGTVASHWQYVVEGAYQFGTKQDPTVKVPVDVSHRERDINAFGGNAKLSYLTKDRFNNQFHLVFEYLSGDNPKTPGQDEMFDILWGRWSQFSELYIYSYIQETGGRVAQLNNIERIGAGWTLSPVKDLNLSAFYNAWLAPESVPTRALTPALFSGNGNFRGHFLQTTASYQFSPHLKGHLWGEWVWQGDYYAQRDLMTFLRAEVTLTW